MVIFDFAMSKLIQ